MSRELLKQALDALENPALPVYTTLRKEIRMALAAPQPEPVAVVNKDVVPGPYLREVPPVERSWEVDKKKALDDLKQGIVINGLQLVERDRLEVK